jgi:Ca-activated chloride channel family protein
MDESPSWQPSVPARPDRRTGRASSVVAGIGAALLVLVLATSVTLIRRGTSPVTGCPVGTVTLKVAVAPELAPVVTEMAHRLADRAVGTTGTCRGTTVRAVAPAAVMSGLSSPDYERPDVWIPDSSIWAFRAGAAGTVLPAQNTSVARSPVVLAVTRSVAADLGWPTRRVDFGPILPSGQGDGPVRLGLSDLNQSTAAVGTVIGLQAALAKRPDAKAALAVTLRSSRRGLPSEPGTLLATLATEHRSALSTTEQAVWAYNAGNPSEPAVATYPSAGQTVLDYPYLVLANDRDTRSAADRLLADLRSEPGRQLLYASGFRDADGRPGPSLTRERGVDPTVPALQGVPDGKAVDEAVRTVTLLNLGSRMLAVIDVSGSMAQPVRGANGRTRLDLLREATGAGLAIFPDDAEIGLWVFATNLTPNTDFRELVPIGPLGARDDGINGREKLSDALSTIQVAPNGETGLYDTTLAAVRAVRAGWDPQRVNSVVLLTDGRNEDSNGITLDQLLATLRAENDPQRPVPVVTIGYGDDADEEGMTAVGKLTGGAFYSARDPRTIRQIFLDAVGSRACRPDC